MTDTITSALLIAAMVAFFAMGGALVSWWDKTWKLAVEPTVESVYRARIGPSDCLAPIAGGGSGKRVVG